MALDRLDKRRQAIWDQLVEDPAKADNSAVLSQEALERWRIANTAPRTDQAAVIKTRDENQYPDCPKSAADQIGHGR